MLECNLYLLTLSTEKLMAHSVSSYNEQVSHLGGKKLLEKKSDADEYSRIAKS